MIVPCECGAKLKIDETKIAGRDVRIRCPRCGNVISVVRPDSEQPVPPAPVAAAPIPAPFAAPSAPPAASPSTQNAPLVLVAHDSDMVREMVSGVLLDAGFRVEHAADGIDALVKAAERLPQVMIIDVGLPGIYGFDLCERLRGDKALHGIKIILLASVYGVTRYKRKPTSLYGADDYIEKHHIADSLVDKVNALLQAGDGKQAIAAPPAPPEQVAEQPAAQPEPRPEPRPEPKPVPRPFQTPAAPVTLPPRVRAKERDGELFQPSSLMMADDEQEERRELSAAQVARSGASSAGDHAIVPDSFSLEHTVFDKEECDIPAVEEADPQAVEKAKRFARIIVSDIALYNQEAVIEGVRKGTFYELLRDDVEDGRRLFDERVPAAIRARRDYYTETIENFIAAQKKIVR